MNVLWKEPQDIKLVRQDHLMIHRCESLTDFIYHSNKYITVYDHSSRVIRMMAPDKRKSTGLLITSRNMDPPYDQSYFIRWNTPTKLTGITSNGHLYKLENLSIH